MTAPLPYLPGRSAGFVITPQTSADLRTATRDADAAASASFLFLTSALKLSGCINSLQLWFIP